MIILFLSHIIGDYYFQTENLAVNKKYSISKLLLHSMIYFLSLLGIGLVFYESKVILYLLIIALTHFLVDLISSGFLGFQIITSNKFLNHFFDQIIHFATLLSVFIIFNNAFVLRQWVITFMQSNDFQSYLFPIILFIASILYLIKPVKLIVNDLLTVSLGESKDKEDNKKSVYLGYLERVLVYISIILGTWLVLSVLIGFKTWAQTERLKNESGDFPKRYLIGTIASIIPAILLAGLYVWFMKTVGLSMITI